MWFLFLTAVAQVQGKPYGAALRLMATEAEKPLERITHDPNGHTVARLDNHFSATRQEHQGSPGLAKNPQFVLGIRRHDGIAA
jgi:hypothetical protein